VAVHGIPGSAAHAPGHRVDGRRAAILQLLPFSASETPKVNMLHGGFPEVLALPKLRALWFASYLQTYLERDVRAINVRDLLRLA
jgi:predicted AAA+ superfamily ATPase